MFWARWKFETSYTTDNRIHIRKLSRWIFAENNLQGFNDFIIFLLKLVKLNIINFHNVRINYTKDFIESLTLEGKKNFI